MSSRPATVSTVDGLAQLSFVVQGLLEKRAAAHDVSIAQTRLMGILRDRTPTMNELARLLELDKSSVTGLVDRAERRGLVERRPSPTDGRAVTVHLAAVGRKLVGKVGAEFGRDVVALMAELSALERTTLTQLVTQVLLAHAAAIGVEVLPS